MSIHTILTRELNANVDVLVMDVEGLESKLIYAIPFDICKPGMIVFESGHQKYLPELASFLGSNGYEVKTFGGDSIAILK